MFGYHVTTQCPYCDAPNTTVVLQGKQIVGLRHSTIAADLACEAVRKETQADVDANEPVLVRFRKPRLTMDYLAIAKCAADGAYVRRKARDAAILEDF